MIEFFGNGSSFADIIVVNNCHRCRHLVKSNRAGLLPANRGTASGQLNPTASGQPRFRSTDKLYFLPGVNVFRNHNKAIALFDWIL
jgi:hypothetical protein